MTKPWYIARPELLEDIKKSLSERYPNLHLFKEEKGCEVRGSFSVRGADGSVIDRFSVIIKFPDDYPDGLPIVYEVGCRIPRIDDRHVNATDGACCIIVPDARWSCFPVGASFQEFLEVPVHNFFLGQLAYEQSGVWPFGQLSHGVKGLYEYYADLLQTEDRVKIQAFVGLLARKTVKGHYPCFCGSGRRIRDCCDDTVREYRSRISPNCAERTLTSMRKAGT